MKKLAWLFLAFAALLPQMSWARHAETMMIPTRVVMENADRYRTIVVKNTGDATGNYTLDLVDMKMLENGAIVPYPQGEQPQFSAIPYIHVAPKSTTLKPGESQTLRVMLRKPENMEPGEYRAHLRVRIVDDEVDQPVNPSAKGGVITVKANLVILIPVIVRNGSTTLSMGIDRPKLVHDARGGAAIEMYLTREGNRSSMGDISVICSQRAASQLGAVPQVIKFFPGVPVYRATARRFISVPLDETPKGVNLAQCKQLGVIYTAQREEGNKQLALVYFTPQ